jgi:hypothetical protein
VLIFGALDIVRCTRPELNQAATLGFLPGALHYNSPDCPVSQRSNGSLRANDRLCRATMHYSAAVEVRAQKSEVTGLSGVAPDCPVWHQIVRCS